MIDYYVFRVKDKDVANVLFDNCLDDNTLLRQLMHQIGWQGGTIHQVAAYIRQQKVKWNKSIGIV